MFGTVHLVVLPICIVLIVLGAVFTRKIKYETMVKIMLGIGIVSETIKVFMYILMNEENLHGYLPKTDLPFHLCSIQIIFIIILYLSKNENLCRILRSFMLPTCLIGGFAAIMIPTSSSTSHFGLLTLQYFGYHTAIMVFAIYLLLNKEIKFEFRDYKTCLVLLFCTMFAAIYINSMLFNAATDNNFFYEVSNGESTATVQAASVNFMYVVGPPQSGLPFLNKNHGWGVYMAHYACTCLFAITAVYAGVIIDAIKQKRGKKRQNNSETK